MHRKGQGLMRRFPAALAAALVVVLAFAVPAFAHPHIFIDAKAAIVFNNAGDVVAVRHTWTFDEAFSAWSIQGMDTNNDGITSEAELQPLADENMKGLQAYNYYTSAGEPGQPDLTFHYMPNPRLDYANQQVTLRFGIQLDQPHHIQNDLEIGIDDPEYYVAITFAGPGAISLENAPPGCHAVLNPPKEIPVDLANQLASIGADVVKLPPDLEAAMRGMQGSIDVKCDYAVTGAKQNPTAENVTPANASTAVDAANAMGTTAASASGPAAGSVKPIPFGGPPRELGMFLPNTGLVLWIINEQKQFYQLLTDTMTRLKTNNMAFLVLGGLSFLYGVFHAAGPGHGKVVISSYVLANEKQYRQGMWLSFISSMLASLVAVLFIVVAAMVLNLTGDAMGNAANWIGIGSYVMVALLGLWLMIRHVFGIGHRHGHTHDDPDDDHRDRAKARRLLYADDNDGHAHPPHGDHHHHDHEHGAMPVTPPAGSLLARAFETSAGASRHAAARPAYAYAEVGHGHGHPHHEDDEHDHDTKTRIRMSRWCRRSSRAAAGGNRWAWCWRSA